MSCPPRGPAAGPTPPRRQIVVASGPADRQLRTLVHELAHALGLGYGQYGRERAEVLVDCVTYIVCASVGLDVGGESIPYGCKSSRVAARGAPLRECGLARATAS